MENRDLSSGGDINADDLTWREQEILNLLGEHLTNREIAERLCLAETTVKDYVGKILSKLYVKNRRQAVERGRDLGLLSHTGETASVPRTHLPPERTPFVGRRDELMHLARQLEATRLLSLTGPGGIGKTRLALKAAESAAGEFKDGIYFVPLAPIRSTKDMIQTVAEGLKFPIATNEDPQLQLLRYLQKRQLLLVMDNFEHLLDGVGIVSEILQAAPSVKILATSRERLNLQGEIVLHVGGMGFPSQPELLDPASYDAVTLFIQSASRVRPGFEPSPGEKEQIVNICQIVEGMPLAIELAAAWLHILSVDEIASELEKNLDLLASDIRDAPERHRSIRRVFDHSWSLLDQPEREIFMLLSVFRGGFTRQAGQQVAGASLQVLSGLVNKSLLSRDQDSGRLEMHELLRQYAQGKLEQSPTVGQAAQEAHAAYFAEFMQARWVDLKGPRQMQALSEIEADIENVRAAWRFYLCRRNVPQLWKFIHAIWYVYWIRWWNHAGMQLFAEAVNILAKDSGCESTELRALAMAHKSYFMGFLGLAEQGYQIANESIALLEPLESPRAIVYAYYSQAVNAYFIYRYQEEVEAIDNMVSVAAELGDKWLQATAMFGRGLGFIVQDDYDGATQIAQANLRLCQEIGDVIGATTPLIVLGHAALARGEFEDARKYYLRCLTISQEIGYDFAMQNAAKYLGKVTLNMGRNAEAEKYLLQSLRITKEIGFLRDLVNLLYEYARLQTARDNIEGAVELLALVIQHPASDMYRMLDGRIRDSASTLLETLKAELPPQRFNAALQRGQQLDLDETVSDLLGA